MKQDLDLSLVLACYNEEPVFKQSLTKIIHTLKLAPFSFEIIFIDDRSSDQTPLLIAAACRQYAFCRAIFHQVNQGRGKTVSDGIKIARGKVVGYIDIDLDVSPVYVPEAVAAILENKADVVIANRVYRSAWGALPREIMSRGYRFLADQLLGTGGLDTEAGYKFFKRRKIMPVLALARHPHWFWDTEITVLAQRKRLRILVIPVLFLRRSDKKSSVKVFQDTLDYFVSLWQFRRRLKHL